MLRLAVGSKFVIAAQRGSDLCGTARGEARKRLGRSGFDLCWPENAQGAVGQMVTARSPSHRAQVRAREEDDDLI